eukprot:2540325-Amphidinium_carterae.1
MFGAGVTHSQTLRDLVGLIVAIACRLHVQAIPAEALFYASDTERDKVHMPHPAVSGEWIPDPAADFGTTLVCPYHRDTSKRATPQSPPEKPQKPDLTKLPSNPDMYQWQAGAHASHFRETLSASQS